MRITREIDTQSTFEVSDNRKKTKKRQLNLHHSINNPVKQTELVQQRGRGREGGDQGNKGESPGGKAVVAGSDAGWEEERAGL